MIGSELPVWRESLEKGAITVRLARSHIRFGHFEYFCYSEKGQADKLKQLLDFTLSQHYPQLSLDYEGYKAWFALVVRDTARMIAHWQAVGFAHGVMNTDNMSILGDSFDFGPFAFLDTFKEDFICNHSDPEGRYAFGQQPGVGLWNLQRLAQALTPVLASDDLIAALNSYQHELVQQYLGLMRAKLGLAPLAEDLSLDARLEQDNKDLALIGAFTGLLEQNALDYTQSLRRFGELDPKAENSSLRMILSIVRAGMIGCPSTGAVSIPARDLSVGRPSAGPTTPNISCATIWLRKRSLPSKRRAIPSRLSSCTSSSDARSMNSLRCRSMPSDLRIGGRG